MIVDRSALKRSRGIASDAFSSTVPPGQTWIAADEVWETAQREARSSRREWLARLDKLVSELGRLSTDVGDDFNAPSDLHLSQLETALGILPAETREPEAEIDGSDGSITVRWWTVEQDAAFAITFPGNGKAYGVASSVNDVPPRSWSCAVYEETKLLDGIEDPLIRRALTGNA